VVRIQHGRTPGTDRTPWSVFLIAAATFLAGAALRLDQLRSQVLIQDEWHAVNKIVAEDLRGILLSFGTLDHSIPLTFAYWVVAETMGLSELLMRLPMLVCGLALLIVLPAMVWRPLGVPVALVFGALLATSPLLIVYSRMARPYMMALVLVYVAHWAFHRWWAGGHGRRAGLAYAVCAMSATWLLPVLGPVAFSPLLWAGGRLLHMTPGERARAFRRWLALAVVSGLPTLLVIVPPLVGDPGLLIRSGHHLPGWQTLVGVSYVWLGTPSFAVVLLCMAAATTGAGVVWRRWRAVSTTMGLGLLLMVVLILVARPVFVKYSLPFGRYLLPGLPLLLLCLAAGVVQWGRAVAGTLRGPSWTRRAAAVAPACVLLAWLLASSTLWAPLERPTQYALHAAFHIVPQPAFDMVGIVQAQLPLSPLWGRLELSRWGPLNIAVAPWQFESLAFDAPRWQRASRQRIIPGFVTELCAPSRPGEVPVSPRFRFRNAVSLADPADLAAKAIDVVVYLHPHGLRWEGLGYAFGYELAHCEVMLRLRLGPPIYEDPHLIAFGLSRRGREALGPDIGSRLDLHPAGSASQRRVAVNHWGSVRR
jgi:hypothetical protein